MNVKARDIMTPGTECIGEGETLQDAARKMALANVGALPICGDDDRLHGLITDRDIVVKVVAAGLDPDRVFARDLAQGRPITIKADATVEEVVDRMRARRVRRLPVIDSDRRMIGIVSEVDVTRFASEQGSQELARALSRA